MLRIAVATRGLPSTAGRSEARGPLRRLACDWIESTPPSTFGITVTAQDVVSGANRIMEVVPR